MSEKVDYLTVDPELNGQKWVCLSFVTPELVKNCNVRGLKVRGVYSEEGAAKKRCEELRNIDPTHNIYVAPVGHWLPWCDDPEKAEDFEYAEKELNNIMKAHSENQKMAKTYHEQRKNNMIQENIQENSKKKKKKKDTSKEDDELIEKIKREMKLDEVNNKSKLEEKQLNNKTVELNLEDEKVKKDQEKIQNMQRELEEAEKLYSNLCEK